jgi:hypothetical protein
LLLLTSASGAMAGRAFTIQPRLRLVDSFGNTVAVGSELSMTVSAGASVVGTATASMASGVATFSNVGIGGRADSYTLTFTPAVAGVEPVTQEIVLAPGAASTYGVMLARDTIEIGDTVTVRAQLRDAYQNAVSSPARTVQWLTHSSFARGTFSTAFTHTDAHGVATAVFTADSSFTGDIALVSASDSVDGAWGFQAYATAQIVRAPAVRLRIVNPPPTTVGYDVHQPISVAVADRFGNTVPGGPPRAVIIGIGPGSPDGATIGGSTTVSTVNGVAPFQLYFPMPGPDYRVIATADGLEGEVSAPFTVAPKGTLLLTAYDLGGIVVAGTKLYLSARLNDGWVIHNVHDVHDSRRTQTGPPPGRVVGNTDFLAVLQQTGGTQPSSRILRAAASGTAMATLDLSSPSNCPPAADFLYDGTWFFVGCVSNVANPQPRLLRIGASDGSLVSLVGVSPSAIAHRGGFVYVVTGSEIWRVAKTGGAADALVTGVSLTLSNARRLAVTADSMYWTDFSSPNARIQSAAIDGGSANTVVPDLHPNTWGLRARDEWIYFIENFTLKRFLIANPLTVESVLPGEIVTDFDFDDASLYWMSARSVKKAPHP